MRFESSVNSEGIETVYECVFAKGMFESSVNSEGIETDFGYSYGTIRLRAV